MNFKSTKNERFYCQQEFLEYTPQEGRNVVLYEASGSKIKDKKLAEIQD